MGDTFQDLPRLHAVIPNAIQGVSGGIVNILGGGSMDYSEKISSYKHVSNFQPISMVGFLNTYFELLQFIEIIYITNKCNQ